MALTDFGTLEEHFIPVELKKIPAEYKFNSALIVSLIVITGRKLHTETPQQFHHSRQHYTGMSTILHPCQFLNYK